MNIGSIIIAVMIWTVVGTTVYYICLTPLTIIFDERDQINSKNKSNNLLKDLFYVFYVLSTAALHGPLVLLIWIVLLNAEAIKEIKKLKAEYEKTS